MDARAYIESHAREFIDDLKQWLAIPSISADPRYQGDVSAYPFQELASAGSDLT